MKYYADKKTGQYIGGYDNGIKPPVNSVEIPTAPDHANSVYVNGEWVLSPAVAKEKRKAEILVALDDIDRRTIRPLRENETERLEQLKAQAMKLRKELSEL